MEFFDPGNLTKFSDEFPKMTTATPEVAASQSTAVTSPEYRCLNTTVATPLEDTSSPDAFVYIVVVLSFYALAMTILMVKYIRRENQEAQLSYYFHEFINREKFHTPRYQNRQGVNAIKRTLNKFYQSVGLVEPEKHAVLHDVATSEPHDLDPYKPQVPRLELLDTCSYSDSGMGSEASSNHGNHRGSSSIMIETEDADGGNKSDDELLVVEGATHTPVTGNRGNRDEILPQLNLLESAV